MEHLTAVACTGMTVFLLCSTVKQQKSSSHDCRKQLQHSCIHRLRLHLEARQQQWRASRARQI